MPMAYGFIIAFQQETGEHSLFKLADTIGPKLIGNIYDITDAEKLNLNAVGKKSRLALQALCILDAAYLRRKYEQLSGKKRS